MGIDFKRKKWAIQDEWRSVWIVKKMYVGKRRILEITKIEGAEWVADQRIAIISKTQNISVGRCYSQ